MSCHFSLPRATDDAEMGLQVRRFKGELHSHGLRECTRFAGSDVALN